MADDDISSLLTRGFSSIAEQLRDREQKFTTLSENFIRMEGDIKYIKDTLSKSDSVRLEIRVDNIEANLKDFKSKQDSNANWIRGLLVSVILLLLGFLFNLIRAGFKQ